MSPSTQFSFYGNDVIAFVIPSKILDFSRNVFNQSELNSFFTKLSIFEECQLKTFDLSEVTLQEERKQSVWFPCWWNIWRFLLFFTVFGRFFLSKKVLRLSKDLFRKSYTIKKLTFDSYFAYQSHKLSAEFQLSRKETFFILENLKLIKKSYDNILKTLQFSSEKPQKISLFFPFVKDFWSLKYCMIRFEIRFPEIRFYKFINFELISQIYIKINKIE